jgi:IS30 family transposase
LRGYRPKQANDKARQRRKNARKAVKFTIEVIKIVIEKTKENWSSEQISGWLRRSNVNISHEHIYQYLLEDKRNGGMLYKYLRLSNRKRKKRYGSPERRGQILNKVLIDERPAVVNNKTRLGGWEGDTIIGFNHKGAIVTLGERKSKYTDP